MSALWPVQVALVARLDADAGLAAYVPVGRPDSPGVAAYDGRAPADAVKPYLVIGESTELSEGSVFGARGWSDTIVVHVWSDYPGRKEALEILTLVDAALVTPLVLNGHQAARLRREFAEVLIDTDGETRHVPARYRISTRAVA